MNPVQCKRGLKTHLPFRHEYGITASELPQNWEGIFLLYSVYKKELKPFKFKLAMTYFNNLTVLLLRVTDPQKHKV